MSSEAGTPKGLVMTPPTSSPLSGISMPVSTPSGLATPKGLRMMCPTSPVSGSTKVSSSEPDSEVDVCLAIPNVGKHPG